MLVCNLFGAPSSGKSTLAAGVFYDYKMRGVNCELVTEYAKDCTWREMYQTLTNQPLVFGKQLDRLLRLENKVDLVITDSPILLSAVYAGLNWPESFVHSVIDVFSEFDNINFFLNRVKPYSETGRNQTEEQSDKLAKEIRSYLSFCNIPFFLIEGNEGGKQIILERILERL